MIPVFSPKVTIRQAFSVGHYALMNEISGTSKAVKTFEDLFANFVGRNFGVAVTNGTHALILALKILRIKPGDEVIVPSFSIISSLIAIKECGATPVFVDVDPGSWNIKFENIVNAVTKKTKCVIAIHTYGLPADINAIERFCKSRNIFLVEDAAEAHGQHLGERPCGSFGDVSVFSFYANKHLTTGEGGMVVTNNKEIKLDLERHRNLGFSPHRRFYHNDLCNNYRMSGIQAALGVSQINRISSIIKMKQRQGRYYHELMKHLVDDFEFQDLEFKGSRNNFWVFGCVFRLKGKRDALMDSMFSKGVETRPFFWPLHLQPVVKRLYKTNFRLPISSYLGKQGLYLPMGHHVKPSTQRSVIQALTESVEEIKK